MTADINQLQTYFIILLLVVVAWQVFLVNRLNKIRKHFYSQGLKKNLETIVTEQDKAIADIHQLLKDLRFDLTSLSELNKNNLQKIGFVKFSGFGEAGNISFALALLDAHDNGIVISSLHGREGSRIYSKQIHDGKSTAKLTTEENEALSQIMQHHGKK